MLEKLKALALRYEDLESQLAQPSVYGDAEKLKSINRELKELGPVVEAYKATPRHWLTRPERRTCCMTRISGNWRRRNWRLPRRRWSGWSRRSDFFCCLKTPMISEM